MEAQQGVSNKGISTFLSFGAKNVQPDILEKMLVGRRKTVDLLEKYARDIAQNGVNHQVFIVGPRGSGKTHMLRVLYYRINSLVKAKDLVVAYFAEEEYGISGYLDFLIRIINAFMRWYDDDKSVLEAQLNILRETPESRQEYVAESIISDYVGAKPLLILSENFDTILEALDKEGQSKLRAWLYRHNRISIIATSQAMSPDLGREDRPFYGFFSTISLKKLTYEESLELLRNLAQIEQREDMIAHLAGKGQAQVRAIYELVKGNHRLLVTFYEFLKADSVADLSVIFMKTMNDLKPYYETFIRFLPAQQQKILHYLALAKIPQKGTDIGKNCFIATTSLTKQLSELQRQNLIDALADPTDKRNKLYDVSEPLLRIAIEIGEQREGITPLFVDFLARCYSKDEIRNQKSRFESMYQSESEILKKQKLHWEVEARERALKVREELEFDSKNTSVKEQEYIKAGNTFFREENYTQSVIAYQQAIQLNSKNALAWYFLGNTYIMQSDYKQAISSYQQVIHISSSFEEAWHGLGYAYTELGNYSQAIEALQKATQLNKDNEFVWRNLGYVYNVLGDYSQAINAYLRVVQLNPKYQTSWYNLGTVYAQLKNYEKAIEAYQQAIQLKSDDERSWYNLGNSYYNQNRYIEAINAYQKAIELKPNNEMMWNNLAIVYDEYGDYNKAIGAYENAILINTNFEEAWYNLGLAHYNKDNHLQAINAFRKAIEITPTDTTSIEILSNSIIALLQSQTATEPELADLEKWLQGRSGFEIISNYVTIYRRVIFNKEEKALYKLPKEQRLFFEREILKRPVEQVEY